MSSNISPTSKSVSVMDISPLLKEVYPKPSKKKNKSKRFGRIQRLLEV